MVHLQKKQRACFVDLSVQVLATKLHSVGPISTLSFVSSPRRRRRDETHFFSVISPKRQAIPSHAF